MSVFREKNRFRNLFIGSGDIKQTNIWMFFFKRPVLTCNILKQYHLTKDITNSDIRYEDIFASDIIKQKQVTELYKQLLDIRNNIIQSSPVAETGNLNK